MNFDNYWPQALLHLSEPYDDGVSDHVVISEVNDEPRGGYEGVHKITTALVPLTVVDEVLASRGDIGWEVESWGPHPTVNDGRVFDTRFWIQGRNNEERFQTILNAWKYHDQEVVLPDNVMLMTYALVPRFLAGGVVCWDDPRRPVYDVIRAQSHVDYNKHTKKPQIRITMRRDFLEDYCSLKACAAVSVYYEERYAAEDPSIEEILKDSEGREFPLPGRRLIVSRNKYRASASLFSRIWGSRLMLRPSRRPITDETDPKLVWPDHPGEMTLARASGKWLYGYVSDAVLEEYEGRPEFQVFPESGGVSYGGWWSVGYSNRIGREHIRVELKKLYEGCPPHVIAHWHRFSVPEAQAQKDLHENGEKNIGVRARDLLTSLLCLTASIVQLSDRLDAGFSEQDVCSLTRKEVEYSGWWTQEVMKPLAASVRMQATRDQFLARAVSMFQLFELLKAAPTRNLLLALGVPSKQIADFGSLKLLAVLCQLSSIAKETGLDLMNDSAAILSRWNVNARLAVLEAPFALNGLRVIAAHTPSAKKDEDVARIAAKLGIDISSTKSGWGRAIDALYDRLISDFEIIASILRR